MKKSNIEYYKEVVKRAETARRSIDAAEAGYAHEAELTKNALEEGILGRQGYDGRMGELAQERDTRIEGALSRIDEVAAEYSAEMQELGRLDGNRIDSGTMALLNSGLTLTSKDWQQLADQHRDNALMTRVLMEKYGANRPQEKEPTAVRFGQSPDSRLEVFSKFAKTIYNACKYNVCPSLAGIGRFKTVTDCYNYMAQSSLKDMQPFGDESFDNLDAEFPIETENGKVENVAGKSTSFTPANFNFNFTPIR